MGSPFKTVDAMKAAAIMRNDYTLSEVDDLLAFAKKTRDDFCEAYSYWASVTTRLQAEKAERRLIKHMQAHQDEYMAPPLTKRQHAAMRLRKR